MFFITVLRAVAACLITNAHYTGIYPTDLIANGGLIGDVLFFAISGYCLYNINHDLSIIAFGKWYGKRIWRVYPPVVIMTFIYMLAGFYKLSEHSAVWWYIYPTYYHFVASIIILYIPFFFAMKIEFVKNRLLTLMILIAIVWIVIYLSVYDKSYYHIDTVREPMIRFLFMESMLLGAYFRQIDNKIRNKMNPLYVILALLSFILYFASKLLFSRKAEYSNYQFLNQIIIFVLLYFVMRCFSGVDALLERLPESVKSIIRFISDMTLEIYVVQYVIIDVIRGVGLRFPINWLAITCTIVLSAWILHILCGFIYRAVNKVKV